VIDLDPQMTRLAKRSVVISGHKTSISLENAFWLALKMAARRRKLTVNELVTRIDGARSGNLSSALRVFLLLEPAQSERPAAPYAKAQSAGVSAELVSP
jgi:predicted DNA-binding ribbon-helix-helix protein